MGVHFCRIWGTSGLLIVKMSTVTSEELLRKYVRHGSEPAFEQLVLRHINLVFSTAMRRTGGNTSLAEDITQIVFSDFARKARLIPPKTLVAGWLHRHTCFTAAKALRTELRRQDHERIAVEMNTMKTENSALTQVATVLDEAIGDLDESDRNAIALRFFDQLDLQSVGQALGITADAAQKRVSRAVDRLRVILGERGVSVASAVLIGALSGFQSTAAPTGLAGAITHASLAGGAASGIVGWLTAPKFSAGAMALVGAALFLPLILYHGYSVAELGKENTRFREAAQQLSRLPEENASLTKLGLDAAELARLRQEHLELMRLRGKVTMMGRELAAATPTAQTQTLDEQPPKPEEQPPRPAQQLTVESRFVELPLDQYLNLSLPGIAKGARAKNVSGVLTEPQAKALIRSFEQTLGVDVLNGPKVTTLTGRPATVELTEEREVDGEKYVLGPRLNVSPSLLADGMTISLGVQASASQMDDATAPDSPQLALQNFTASAQSSVFDGQTLLFGGPKQNSDKAILVLVTPTLIDSAGNRLHPPEDLERTQ
jgi:RNA polymerase sigma factor (sigma-70 family)